VGPADPLSFASSSRSSALPEAADAVLAICARSTVLAICAWSNVLAVGTGGALLVSAHWMLCKLLGPKEPRFARLLQSPLTDSNRRPPRYHAGPVAGGSPNHGNGFAC
jgi:hypothetical protein